MMAWKGIYQSYVQHMIAFHILHTVHCTVGYIGPSICIFVAYVHLPFLPFIYSIPYTYSIKSYVRRRLGQIVCADRVPEVQVLAHEHRHLARNYEHEYSTVQYVYNNVQYSRTHAH